jgi:acetate---CoA ligase (ADP-forming)
VSDTDALGRPTALRHVDLATFFRPKTLAIIGASDTPRRPNTAMTAKIRRWADAHGATVYPVNPNRDTVDGLPCHRSVLDIPVEVDLAAILVGDPLQVLPEAIAKGARFAVVFAAGFAEVGVDGERAQAELERLVAAHDLRLLGPNTNLNAFELFREDLPGRAVALITQSGHQGRPIFQAQDVGLHLSHWAPTGNEADLEYADFAGWFAEQEDVGVIASYVEGFKDGRTLMLAADRAARRGVPLVTVKVGRTEEGRAMARAHTGHLTGADAVISAVFRQFGITRVDGLDELQDTAAMFSRAAPRDGDGVCVYAISGGTGAHMADMAAAAGLRLPELTAETQQALRQWIPDYLRVSNPVDSGGPPSGDERGRRILDAIVADPGVDIVICPITGVWPSMGNQLATDLVEVARTTDKPICVVWGSPVGTEEAYTDVLLRGTLPVFRTFSNCVQAVKAYVDHQAFRRRYRSPFADPSLLTASPVAATARALLTPGRAMSEVASKALLAAYGIPVSRDLLVGSAAEAVAAAERIGFPVVLKASSADLLHKSDLGLVAVGLRTPEQVRSTYAQLVERAAQAAPAAQLDGVLVCELVSGGVETVIGVAQDELFGPTVMFGLGGVMVEVLRDVTFRVPPFDADEARRMIAEVAGHPLLTGVRGRPPADLDALVQALLAVQRLAVDLGDDLAELDVNPLVVRERGAVALDALVVPR